jgi:dinuclear metal center YbgI/SA1388 family protein
VTATVEDVVRAIREIAPPALALAGDPTGLQVGSPQRVVSRVLVTLDLTVEVAREAAARGAGLIVSHHAVVFRPLQDLRTDRPRGRILASLLSNDTAVYVPHTALDVAPGGTNDRLAGLLGLSETAVLDETGRDGAGTPLGIGRIGRVAPTTLGELARTARERLGARAARIVGDPGRAVDRVAVLAGDGRRYIEVAASRGADAIVTGDVDHHTALEARARGLGVVDIGHHASERLVVDLLVERLRGSVAAEVVPSEVDTDPFAAL